MPDTVTGTEGVLTLETGQVVFAEGEAGATAFVVLSGAVELTRGGTPEGGPATRVGPGEVFGLCSVLEECPRAATARTVGATQLLPLEGRDLARVAANPELALLLLRRLAQQIEGQVQARAGAVAAGSDGGAAPAGAGPAAPPRLLTADGRTEFPLPAEGEITVGRQDSRTGVQPDLDLTPLDEGRSLSRRHARLTRRGAGWVVTEEPRVANGTFVNGERLGQGEVRDLADGDELRFGNVCLRFRER